MHRNYSRWRPNESPSFNLAFLGKTGTFPYQDLIEGENKRRNKCTNGIGKIKRKISNLQKQVKHAIHRSSKTR